jgi:hypothetical protein
MIPASPRPLRRAQRALAYAMLGWSTDIAFAPAQDLIHRDTRDGGRLVIRGATRLDYAPLWAAAGLALEHVDDGSRSVRFGWAS